MLVLPKYEKVHREYRPPAHPQEAESSFAGLSAPIARCQTECCTSPAYPGYEQCLSCLKHHIVECTEAVFLAPTREQLREKRQRWEYRHPTYRLELLGEWRDYSWTQSRQHGTEYLFGQRHRVARLRRRPMAAEVSAADIHPTDTAILRFFDYAHLPPPLQEISQPICDLAWMLAMKLPDGPELTVGLRKLLEAKDAFVRAALPERRPDGDLA